MPFTVKDAAKCSLAVTTCVTVTAAITAATNTCVIPCAIVSGIYGCVSSILGCALSGVCDSERDDDHYSSSSTGNGMINMTQLLPPSAPIQMIDLPPQQYQAPTPFIGPSA
ncbi:MAG: hypothetical protein ABSF18_05350 [Gammaproteobacteria bacterium]|jgi:hypothetical protein